MKHVQNEFNIRLNVEYIPIVNVANMDGQTMQFEAGLRTNYVPSTLMQKMCFQFIKYPENTKKNDLGIIDNFEKTRLIRTVTLSMLIKTFISLQPLV